MTDAFDRRCVQQTFKSFPKGEGRSVVTIIAGRPRPVPDRKLVANKGPRHVTAGRTLELLSFRYGLYGCTRL